MDEKNLLSLIFVSFSIDLLLKKEIYKAIKVEEPSQNITKYREVVSQKVMLCILKIMRPRDVEVTSN